jgi:protein-S-isoprenylcysteine O-methyltransferase Ste14
VAGLAMHRTIMLIRHLLAIAVLPFVVTVVVPRWLTQRGHLAFAVGQTAGVLVVQGAGVLVLLIGLALFASSLRRFAGDGHGTLAPWDPPRRLVISGPYRHVRNPMISGVILVLCGEALLFVAAPLAQWAAIFFALNAVHIPLFEEPQLARRFGADYAEYCRHVPRLVPRIRPWSAPL